MAFYHTAASNGMSAPLLMSLIIMIANKRDIMGRFANSRVNNIPGWMIVPIITLAGMALIVNLVTGQ